MIRTALAVALLLSALPLGGCDAGEAQDAFEAAASARPSGIARTDASGTLLADDPDDWRTAPLYATSFFSVTIRPYPNPVSFSAGETVTLQVTTGGAIPGGLRLVAYKDGLRRPIPGGECFVGGPDVCDFAFFPGEIAGAQPGDLWRLILFDGRGNVVTYGDLLIDP